MSLGSIRVDGFGWANEFMLILPPLKTLETEEKRVEEEEEEE